MLSFIFFAIVIGCNKLDINQSKTIFSSYFTKEKVYKKSYKSYCLNKAKEIIKQQIAKNEKINEKEICNLINKAYAHDDSTGVSTILGACYKAGLIQATKLLLKYELNYIKSFDDRIQKDELKINVASMQPFIKSYYDYCGIEVLEYMLSRGFSPDSLYREKHICTSNGIEKKYQESKKKSSSMLMYAASRGDLNLAKLLLKYHISVKHIDSWNRSALDIALEFNNLDIAREIFKSDMDSLSNFDSFWHTIFQNEKDTKLGEEFLQNLVLIYMRKIEKLSKVKELKSWQSKEIKKDIVISRSRLLPIYRFNTDKTKDLYVKLIKTILEYQIKAYKVVSTNVEEIEKLQYTLDNLDMLPLDVVTKIISSKNN